MKFLLVLLELLLFCCMLNAFRRNPLKRNIFDKGVTPAPSDKILKFLTTLNGVFSTEMVDTCQEVPKRGNKDRLSLYFRIFDVPALRPATTIVSYGVRNGKIVFEEYLAVTEMDDVIYITVYLDLNSRLPRDATRGVFTRTDFSDLKLRDLTKRCDCTRIFVEDGLDAYTGVWQLCNRDPYDISPEFEAILTCNRLQIIGFDDFKRVLCCGRYPLIPELLPGNRIFVARCGSDPA